MKRIISCILCMILVLSLLPAGSFATVTTRVYCNAPGTWEQCFVYYWGASGYSEVLWPGVSMERDEKGIWYYDVPSEATKLIFNNGLGTQTADLDLPADLRNMYDFQERCWTEYGGKPYVPVYYVAGVEELCGIAWDPSASENKMTYVDGIYTKTYTDVAAGVYEFKVTNGTWDWSWGASNGFDNYIFTVEQDNSTVVITFNPATELVNAEVIGPETPKDFGAILQEAYGLEEGMSLPYCATLVGDIIDVVTPYDSFYNNITVEIVVPGYESMPVLCYRLCGDGVNNLAVGDTITVSGFLWNYRGIIEFEQGCSLDAVIKGDIDVPAPIEDPLELVDAAYALAPGESLPYMSVLTGQIVSVDTPYSETYHNITVTIIVEGRENKPIVCYRLKGDGTKTLAEGDVITVKGVLQNYAMYGDNGALIYTTVEFNTGCQLLDVSEKEEVSTRLYCYTPWEQCYVYFWSASNFECGWPGMLMTDEGNGLWSYEIPGGTEYLIFNSGDGLQTYDLTVPTDENILYIVESCEWTDLSWSGPDDNIRSLTVVAPESWGQLYIYTWEPETYGEFPGKPLGKDGDVYRDVISSELTYMVISAAEPGGGYYDTGVIDLRTGTDGVTVIIDGIRSYSLYYDDYQENTYRVVGNADFMGNWDCASDAGRMHQIDDGVYQVEFENVPPGYYEFRITLNGVWDDSLGYDEYSNFTFDLSEISDVCVTFYEYSRVVDISYDGNNDNFGLDSLALVGTGLPGINEWDPADPAGDMTEIADLVYQKTLTFKAGTAIEFKIVANDIWDPHCILGGTDLVLNQITYLNASPYASTLQLYIERDCQLTFTVDLRPLFDGGYATLLVEEVDSPTPAQRKLTINMPGTWQYVNIYTWSPDTYGTWPGTQVPYNGQSYQTMIDANMENLIINGLDSYGNFRQTDDIYLVCNGKDVTITVRDDMRYDISYKNEDDFIRWLTVLTPASWSNAYIYTWDPVSCGDFPGMALSYDGTSYWTLISSRETNMVISGYRDDGTMRMTDDIHLSAGIPPVTIVIHEDGTHTVIYDDGSPTEGTYRVVGNTPWMGLWDAASNVGIMEEISEGFYQKCFKNVQPGAYEFKITKDGKWDNAIGEADGQNFKFVVSRTSDVYITCAFDTGDALVYCDVAPKPMGDMNGDGKRNMGDVARLYGHIRGTNAVLDSQILVNADMNGDGKLNIGDTARIYAFIRGTDPIGIVDAAYALAPGATLSGLVTLTGEIQSIVIDYSSQRDDIDVQIILKGREDMPILCHGLKGAGIENLAVGDVITVMGTITKHQYSTGISVVQFDAGCTLKAVEK